MFELITIACIWAFCGIGSYSQIKTEKQKAAAAQTKLAVQVSSPSESTEHK